MDQTPGSASKKHFPIIICKRPATDKVEFWDSTMNLIMTLLAPKLSYDWERIADYLPKRFAPVGLTFTPTECEAQFHNTISRMSVGMKTSSSCGTTSALARLHYVQMLLLKEVYNTLSDSTELGDSVEANYKRIMRDRDRLEDPNVEMDNEELNKIIMDPPLSDEDDDSDPDILQMKILRKKVQSEVHNGKELQANSESEAIESEFETDTETESESDSDEEEKQLVKVTEDWQARQKVLESNLVLGQSSSVEVGEKDAMNNPAFSQSIPNSRPLLAYPADKAKHIALILQDLLSPLPISQIAQVCDNTQTVVSTDPSTTHSTNESEQRVTAVVPMELDPMPPSHTLESTDCELPKSCNAQGKSNEFSTSEFQDNVQLHSRHGCDTRKIGPRPYISGCDSGNQSATTSANTLTRRMSPYVTPSLKSWNARKKVHPPIHVLKKGELERNVKSRREEAFMVDVPDTDSEALNKELNLLKSTTLPSTQKDCDIEQRKFRQLCLLFHERVQGHKYAHKFELPSKTSSVGAAYYAMIKNPKSMKTIKRDITQGVIKNFEEYERDLSVMFLNATTYNAKDSELVSIAKEMSKDTFKILDEYKYTQRLIAEKKLAESDADPFLDATPNNAKSSDSSGCSNGTLPSKVRGQKRKSDEEHWKHDTEAE